MPELSDLYDVTDDGVVLHVHVQPGAGKTAVVGRHGNALKVRVAAPPVAGRANEAAAEIVAEVLDVRAADIELSGGEKSRAKRFRVNGISVDEVEVQLRHALDAAASRIGEPRRPPT